MVDNIEGEIKKVPGKADAHKKVLSKLDLCNCLSGLIKNNRNY